MTRLFRREAGHWWLVLPLAVMGMGAAGREVPLIEAVKQGDALAIKALVQRVDVNTPAVDGTTALHWAAHREDLTAVELLIRAGANAKAVTRFGITPLTLASENGNAAIIERLLKAGADPNTAAPGGETPLMTAARTGRVDTVKVLLAHGANVNAQEGVRGQTALMWAASDGSVALVKALLEAGADIHSRSSSPRPQAAALGDVWSDKEKTATGPFGSMTALLLAARRGQIDVVRTLLDAGANPNDEAIVLERVGPANAVTLAIANAHYEVAALLLDKGADATHAGQGWTALHQLSWARSEPGSARMSEGWTPGPLMTGSVSGLELAAKLIARGADVNARVTKEMQTGYKLSLNRIGATPFLLAAKAGDAALMRVLLKNGADPNIPTRAGVSALMVAAGNYQKRGEDSPTEEEALEAVKLCIDLGMDVNAADKGGNAALHGAARTWQNDIVRYLVAHGAKLDQRTAPKKLKSGETEPGLTPLGVAYGGGLGGRHPETIDLLAQLMKERGLPVEEDPMAAVQKGEKGFFDPSVTKGGAR